MLLAETCNFEHALRPKITLAWRGKCAPVPDVIFDDVTEAKSKPVDRLARVLRVDPWVEPSGLDLCLGHWTSWMHQDDRDLGVKAQAGIETGSDEHDDECEHDDNASSDAAIARASREIAIATDAMIRGLSRYHRSAIERRCGIASVWRFPNMDFTTALPEAEGELVKKLSKNTATKVFF